MACGDNRIIFCIVKMEMGSSGRDVDYLEIQSSPRAVGGQFGVTDQAVSAAASYNQGL